jgi:hypothetical protein
MHMDTGFAASRSTVPARSPGPRSPAAEDDTDEADFATMRSAYHAAGGFAGGDDLARLLQDSGRGTFASLARMIVRGEVFGFDWRQTFWIPMFQFSEELEVKPGLKAVLRELKSEYDGRRLAHWFVEPNGWLDEGRPIDVLDSNPDEVLQAARADRFVATG